jgi:hypothetical protein
MCHPTAQLLSLIDLYRKTPIEFPNLKAVTLSQWILESGWGSSDLAIKYNNFGGLKYRKGLKDIARKISYPAHDGVDDYCWFETLENFIEGYWRFIDRAPYAGWRRHARDAEEFISFIGPIYTPLKGYGEQVLDLLPKAERLLGAAIVSAGPNWSADIEPFDAFLLAHADLDNFAKPTVDRYIPTTHKSSRNNTKIDHVVLHYTTSRNIEGTIETFLKGRIEKNTGKLIRTSAHYIIGRDGELVQMVDDSDAAWHAGGTQGMNARSIGIEHSAKRGDELTREQEEKSVALIRWLVKEYDIPLKNIIPHDAVHSTDCPGQIFLAYGKTHAEAVKIWVAEKIAAAALVS